MTGYKCNGAEEEKKNWQLGITVQTWVKTKLQIWKSHCSPWEQSPALFDYITIQFSDRRGGPPWCNQESKDQFLRIHFPKKNKKKRLTFSLTYQKQSTFLPNKARGFFFPLLISVNVSWLLDSGVSARQHPTSVFRSRHSNGGEAAPRIDAHTWQRY